MTQTETRNPALDLLERDREARAIIAALGDRIEPVPGRCPVDWRAANQTDLDAEIAANRLTGILRQQATLAAPAAAPPAPPVAAPPVRRDPKTGKFIVPPPPAPPGYPTRDGIPASVAEVDDEPESMQVRADLGLAIIGAFAWGCIVTFIVCVVIPAVIRGAR